MIHDETVPVLLSCAKLLPVTGIGETFCVYLCRKEDEASDDHSVAPLCEVYSGCSDNEAFDRHCWLTMTGETALGQVIDFVHVYVFVQEKNLLETSDTSLLCGNDAALDVVHRQQCNIANIAQ